MHRDGDAMGERLHAVKMDMPIIGIDTIEAYEQANKYAKEIIRQKDKG